MINPKQATIVSVSLLIAANTYAGGCNNTVSSNLIDETIAFSSTETISINPWPILQLNSSCIFDNGWGISSNLALKETGRDDIEEINDTHIAEANMIFIKDDYKFEVGRFENNMSFNSVFGFALPMKVIPSIQLDEASYLQTVAPDIYLIRITRDTKFGSVYVSGYHADRELDHQSDLHNSFNGGIVKQINSRINIEMQYANESIKDVNARQERLSLFFNISGSLDDQRKWVMAAEINGFENRNFISDNDEVTANLYLELSQKNIASNIDAYVSTGGSYDNQASLEAGIFLNASTLLKMANNISIKAGAAQSHTIFQGGDDITPSRYSIQLRYKM